MPTLTQIRTYNTAHLTEAAPQWAAAADNWQFHTGAALTDVSTLGWTGVNGPSSIAHMQVTHSRALAASAPVASAAALAPAAASDLTALQSRCMTIVGWCLEGAYWVNDDLSLTDMFRAPTTAVYKARSQIEDWLQDLLHQSANDLMTHDTAVAAQLDSHIHALDTVCDDPDYNSGILRRLIGSAAIGGILGGMTAGIPGAIIGAGTAGIGDLLHETQGEGPKCK